MMKSKSNIFNVPKSQKLSDQNKEILFVNSLYEKILKEIYPELNKVGNLNFSEKSWRILIGPWLNRFITVTVNRIKHLSAFKFSSKNMKYKNLITKNISEFTENCQNPDWNKYLCYRLKLVKKGVFKPKSLKTDPYKNNIFKNLSLSISELILKLFERFMCFGNKFVFYKPYLGKSLKTVFLFWKLREVPFLYSFLEERKYGFLYDNELRKKIKLSLKIKSLEEKIIKKILIESIPTFYIEGIKTLKNDLKKSFLPRKKRIIFTGSLLRDNLFKFWAASNIFHGGKLIFKQHGSNYGQLREMDQEKHEIKISDKFFTNGWKTNNKKIIPSCNFQAFNNKFENNISKKILIVSGDLRLFKTNNIFYDQNFYSEVNLIINFIKKFKSLDQKFIDYKSHPLDHKNQFFKEEIIRKNLKNINFLNKRLHLNKIFKNYRLIIFLYNSTDILNLINSNLPILMIMKKNYIRTLNHQAKNIFYKLKKNNLYFDNIDKAFTHIKNNNLYEWWNTKEVIKTRREFQEKYSNISNYNFNKSIEVLKKIKLN